MRGEAFGKAPLDGQVRAEKIEILFQHTPFTLITNVLLSGGLVWVLWDIYDHGGLIQWWIAIVALALVRLAVLIGYRRRGVGNRTPWHAGLTVATLLSGAVWGAAGWLFFVPESPVALIFVTIVLAGIMAGSVSAYSSWPAAQYACVPVALPLAWRYLTEGNPYWVMGLMVLLFLGNVLASARQLARVLDDSIRLRLEKQELVHQLRDEKADADRARLQAEEANIAKSKFLAAASHDLRQPLHALSLFLEALRDEADPSQAGRLIEGMSATAESLEDLLNELLDISKLEAGLFRPHLGILDLQELFAGLESELSPVAESKGIQLGFVATGLRVSSDLHMLRRILRNIILNAIRHTERGAVLVGCRRKSDGVAIAVYDTGPGIAPEYHQAIFREFYQLGNPERDRQKGLGLGLAIVDGLCRVLNHPVSLKSVLGSGSAFFVQVPVAGRCESPQGSAESLPPSLPLGLSVLVVDDEAAVRQAMAEVLNNWGCHALAAESAEEALARIAAEKFCPDVIVADYRLPEGHTGTQAISAIRDALNRKIPALILTGDTAPERLREASASGHLLLHKPVKPARLRAALTSLAGERLLHCEEECIGTPPERLTSPSH